MNKSPSSWMICSITCVCHFLSLTLCNKQTWWQILSAHNYILLMNSIQQRDSLLIETNFICVKWSFVRETTFNISIVKVFERQHAKEKNNDCRPLNFKRKKSFVKQQKSLWSVAFFYTACTIHQPHHTKLQALLLKTRQNINKKKG